MKSLVMILLIASASTAMAARNNDPSQEIHVPATSGSWCEGDKVMGQDREGNIKLLADCGKAGFVCKIAHGYQPRAYVMTAVCAPAPY